ncbi:hypothetical protein VPH35_009530 [Triticum aestivum]
MPPPLLFLPPHLSPPPKDQTLTPRPDPGSRRREGGTARRGKGGGVGDATSPPRASESKWGSCCGFFDLPCLISSL